ncbi:TPA: hypothetical protein RUU56_003420 [Escherichia coli]|nr:hypothetical protein [Escherichia coli]HDZ8623628.1 hypothetical protein [Escherichia coli]
MFYPAVDCLVIILLLAFLMVTLFACIFCLRHEYIRKESEKRKKDFFKKKELNITEFSWFRYNQHNETGINITMDKTIIVMVAVNGRMFSKKYSITSLTFDTKNITEAALYENGIVTRRLTLHRPVSDDRPAGVSSKQLIRTILLCIRQKDHTDDISFILYQGRLEQRGHNYTIIKSKANSVILLLKMLLTNKI